MFNSKVLCKLLIPVILTSALAACTSSVEDEVERVPDRSPQARYADAKQSLNNQMFTKAIAILTELENRYPFGPLSRQVQLDLIFAYYKSGQFDQALPAIDRFIKLNPSHPKLDYVQYMRGLVNMETGLNGFQDFFGVENADKDMVASRDAFHDFKRLIANYPNSAYIPDAKKRMVSLLDKIARHEIVIAEYYMRRSAYVAAINRCKYVLEFYPQSSALVPALKVMIQAYDSLGLVELKADTERVLAENS